MRGGDAGQAIGGLSGSDAAIKVDAGFGSRENPSVAARGSERESGVQTEQEEST